MQKTYALPQRVDRGFIVQRKPDLFHLRPDVPQAFAQVFLIRVDQQEIIHVANIVPNVQALFDIMVKVIQHCKLHKLADLATEANPTVSAE